MATQNNEVLAENINTLALMYQLQNVLLLMEKNLNLILSGSNGTVITVNGGSLFQIAASYYGDATLWTTIAIANGLSDPELPVGEAMTLSIPLTASQIGGVVGT